MSQDRTITLDEALDLAVEKLGPLRERVMKRRLRNAEYRQGVLDELALKLSSCPDCAAMGVQQVFSAPGYSSSTAFQINLDNLERFLQIVIKYLPTILDIVLKFLPLFIAVLAMLMIANTANGQTCESGVCRLPTRAPVMNVLSNVARPVVSVIEAQPVRSTVGVAVRTVQQIPQVVRHQVQKQRAIVTQRRRIRWFQPRRLFSLRCEMFGCH